MSHFDGVEQLALAVVKPGGNALFLNEDNTAVDYWVPVDQAAQSGMPFLVELKENLAAVDLDSDELVPCGEALKDWALSEGWPVVVVTSGRAGHRHLLALAIASGLRGAGYDFHTYRTVMANRDNAGGAKYHALEDGEGREKPDAFLARTWEKAADRLSPAEIVAELESARAAVVATDWTGRTGNTDRAVMLALCQLGIDSGLPSSPSVLGVLPWRLRLRTRLPVEP